MRQDEPAGPNSKNSIEKLNREQLEMYLGDHKRDHKV